MGTSARNCARSQRRGDRGRTRPATASDEPEERHGPARPEEQRTAGSVCWPSRRWWPARPRRFGRRRSSIRACAGCWRGCTGCTAEGDRRPRPAAAADWTIRVGRVSLAAAGRRPACTRPAGLAATASLAVFLRTPREAGHTGTAEPAARRRRPRSERWNCCGSCRINPRDYGLGAGLRDDRLSVSSAQSRALRKWRGGLDGKNRRGPEGFARIGQGKRLPDLQLRSTTICPTTPSIPKSSISSCSCSKSRASS